jgi:hypothetical protein
MRKEDNALLKVTCAAALIFEREMTTGGEGGEHQITQ